MPKHRACTAVECDVCGKTIGRKADLVRHMKTHAMNREELMHACPYLGCTYKTLQRSNLATHLNVHSRERPNHCPAEGCDFSSSDPGSLTRHRKEIHGYEPKANSNSGNHPSAITRKAARQRRRISPYTTSPSTSSGSSARSVSPLDSSSSMYPSPRPQVPQMPDPCSSTSPLLADGRVGDGIKNTSAVYSAELNTSLPQVNYPLHMSNPQPETSLLLNSGLLAAPEAPVVEYPQVPMLDQGNLSTVDLPAQPVSEMTPEEASDAELDRFFAQIDDLLTEAVPAYTAPSLPMPVAQYTVDNALVPTPAPLPAYEATYTLDINAPVPTPASLPSYEVSYTVDNALVPPASFPSYEISYTVDNAPVPTPASLPSYEASYAVDNAYYEPYAYPAEGVSFDAQVSQPYSFAAPDMGLYPEVIDQAYFIPTSVATSSLPMQEHYRF